MEKSPEAVLVPKAVYQDKTCLMFSVGPWQVSLLMLGRLQCSSPAAVGTACMGWADYVLQRRLGAGASSHM